MAYDEKLAMRVRKAVGRRKGVTEMKMFGGLAFMLNGNMFCGIIKEDLMVRVGPDRHEESLKKPHARPMDFAGRPMKGYVFVAPGGSRTEASLAEWVRRGVENALTLPKKR